jgi:hypothetical protein
MFNPAKLSSKYVDVVLKNGFRTSRNKFFNNLLIKTFCKKIGVNYGVTVSSGTAGLHVALMSLGLKKNDEVIMPSITMSAVAYAILLSGAKPVFADIDKETLNIDFESVKKKINSKTKAIICVSLFGLPPDYTELLKIISRQNKKIYLIEDNAECMFAKHKNKFAGSYGDFAVFSFQSSKILTCGEGGILVTKNKELYIKSKMYSNLGYYINQNSYNKNRINLKGVVAEGRTFPNLTEIRQVSTTFILVTIAWIFFRANGLNEALNYLKKLILNLFNFRDLTYFKIPSGIGVSSFIFIPILLIVDWRLRHDERKIDIPKILQPFRILIYVLLVFFCLSYLVANQNQSFIYFQF